MVEVTTAKILERWVEPGEGEPRIRPDRQWRLFRRFLDQEEREGFRRPVSEGDEGSVTALEALALARLIVDSLRGSFPWLIVEAREEGAPWTAIGEALGLEERAARDLLRGAADDLPEDFADVRDQYLRTAADAEA